MRFTRKALVVVVVSTKTKHWCLICEFRAGLERLLTTAAPRASHRRGYLAGWLAGGCAQGDNTVDVKLEGMDDGPWRLEIVARSQRSVFDEVRSTYEVLPG